MSIKPGTPGSPHHRATGVRLPEAILLLARAIEGDEDGLRAVLQLEGAERLAAGHRLAPALALRARSAWVENPILQTWKRDLMWVAGRWLALRQSLEDLSRVLGAEDIPWFPIKGGDLAFRVYDSIEERPAGDLDVLVPADRVEHALEALLDGGYRYSLPPGRHGLDFVRDEGYNYQLVQPVGTLLELHFRLWGIVPEGLAADLFGASKPDASLGPTARRLPLPHAFVIAAVHHWNSDPPHPLLGLWDLRKIMQ
ncbi:MAG: nucleotidyltransferase family protein, partial [Acidobacteria bacterium]|nr:nucleotidyltransferase family protein [Acidobacteriota bacterium]